MNPLNQNGAAEGYAAEPDAKPLFREEGTLEQLSPSNFQDERTEPTPGHRLLTSDEAGLVAQIKAKVADLEATIGFAPKGRRSALAQTNLEQAGMWAIKAVIDG